MLLGREGEQVNHKRVHRIYREVGLALRRKKRKYCASLPLYRQQAILRRDAGVDVALSTLNDAVLRVGELLLPIAAAMKRELLAGTYIQAGRVENRRSGVSLPVAV